MTAPLSSTERRHTAMTKADTEKRVEVAIFSSSKSGTKLFGLKCPCGWHTSELLTSRRAVWAEWDAHWDGGHND